MKSVRVAAYSDPGNSCHNVATTLNARNNHDNPT